MLRSKDCYEPEVWEKEPKKIDEELTENFNNVYRMIFASLDADPDYRYVKAQHIA